MAARKYQNAAIANMKIRLRIAEAIKTAGNPEIRTMKDLAKKLEVDHQAVLYWNQGRNYPRLPMLIYVCVLLRTDPLELIEVGPRGGS